MKKNGFISTSLIISIIVLASSIIFLIINKSENNNNLTTIIELKAKERLTEVKKPNCFFGLAPTMELGVTSFISLTCTHPDDIDNNLESIDFTFFTTDLEISIISVTKITKGYEVILELDAPAMEDYYITLKDNTICTSKFYCNEILTSNLIHINS